MVHHPCFEAFRTRPAAGPLEGTIADSFLGTVRPSFLRYPPVEPGSEGSSQFYPAFDNEYFEWVAVLESVLAAHTAYTIGELGAGYGRWAVRAATAARQRGLGPVTIIAAEPDPDHYRWLFEHFRANHLDPEEHRLLNVAVEDREGSALFAVGRPPDQEAVTPEEWFGQAVYWSRLGLYEAAASLGRRVLRMSQPARMRGPDGWQVIRVRKITLNNLLLGSGVIDLLDMDIQGSEGRVVASAMPLLEAKVKRLYISTHNEGVEPQLRSLLRAHGWTNRVDLPLGRMHDTEFGQAYFGDGVQDWINPRLA